VEKKVYLVGGAVRDKLLNIKITDKDYVAVGYKESDFQHLKKVGKNFPVFLMEDGNELALARVDNKTSLGYNGFEVSTKNVTIKEDLARRDLTINSIAYDEKNNLYIDPYNGKSDIKNKILRHTTNAFVEDPLRVLRVARFRAKLGKDWNIDKDTKFLIKNMKNELKYLQEDRIYKEIKKVLELKSSYLFFQTLFELDVLNIIFPTIYKYKENIKILKLIANSSDLVKLAVIYENIEIDKDIIDIKIPTKLKNNMLFIINNYEKLDNLNILKIDDIIDFFKSLKKNIILLKEMIYFCKLKNIKIDENKILTIFKEISNYSPFKWINSQKEKPSNDDIKNHIYKENKDIIKRYL